MIDTLFVVKKVVSEFLGPLSIGLVVAASGLYALYSDRLKTSKILITIAFIWISLMSYGPVSDMLLKPLEQQYPALLATPQEISYVMVLGSGHTSNAKLPISSQLSRTAVVRLSEGIRQYNNLQNAKLVVSGYNGFYDPSSHASMQKRLALSLGVKREDIMMFEEPKDTEDEALAMKARVGSEPFILVTSASHMPRAIRIFTHLGLNPIAAPTDYNAGGKIEWLHMPDGDGLQRSNLAFHEYYGLIWQWIKG
ncbi:MAG: envelope biogenesis factor ElyC [Thiovulaceae bacterium]|nr:envelope biogenesis factor ElyC [Sulfurimonadaceae bacterium]